MTKPPIFIAPSIRINQPLGMFFVASIPAPLLRDVCFVDPTRADWTGGDYRPRGTQRWQSDSRKKEIGRYIDSVEAAFPNSIILAANIQTSGQPADDPGLRWRVEQHESGCFELVIPTRAPLAKVIDGQHRLLGFDAASKNHDEFEMLCAIYLDLPEPFQAYLFATINFNQRKVDRGLAYDLFGYNLEEEPAESWSPEKLAVFIARRLVSDQDSPFYRRIAVAPEDDTHLAASHPARDGWTVSMATVVDGILRLISANPSADRDLLHRNALEDRKRSQLESTRDRSPLREMYLSGEDIVVYSAVNNYFKAVERTLWESANQRNSYITKTVGFQALFDVLRVILSKHFEARRDVRVSFFESFLRKAMNLDFSQTAIQASGIGRTRIRKFLLVAMGLESKSSLSDDEGHMYDEVARSSNA